MVDILESKVVGTNKETWYKLVGTPEDTKPTGEFPAGTGHTVAKNSTFFEIGTQIRYEFDGSAWAPKGQVDIKLIEKEIIANGTYNPADDDADGYSSVTVDVVSENNAKLVFGSDTTFRTSMAFESLYIPDGYTLVGGYAFQNNTLLKSVEIPSSITAFGTDVFAGCKNLKTITINKPEDSIPGAPWGAPSTAEVIWTG